MKPTSVICCFLFAGMMPAALCAGELTDRFVAEARRVYATEEYADCKKSILNEPAYRGAAKRVPRADLGEGTVRWIDVDGTCNFRDIGGWTGLRTGRVYRGAEPNCHTNAETLARLKIKKCHDLFLTEKGAATLSRDLKIRTDLDLRSSGESPTPDETPVPGAKLVRIACSSYTNFLRDTKTAAKLLRVFADEANYPVYFHCYGGADRTGSLAFLLEGLCGVSEVDLSIDYELTSFSRIGFRPRYDESYYFASMVREMKRRPGNTMKEKIERYVLDECGLSPAEVANIRKAL